MILYQKLLLHDPDFNSTLTDNIIALEVMKNQIAQHIFPDVICKQLRQIAHRLRCGNILYKNDIDSALKCAQINRPAVSKNHLFAFDNLKKALDLIDDVLPHFKLTSDFLCDLHWITMQNVTLPSIDKRNAAPGKYRSSQNISNVLSHEPPQPQHIASYIDELCEFAQKQTPLKYEGIKAAIILHRFAWIQPFANGNSRMFSLLYYAYSAKLLHIYHSNGTIGLSDTYSPDFMNHLSNADTGIREDILTWCDYYMGDILETAKKNRAFCDYNFFKETIISPVFSCMLHEKKISESEYKILKRTLDLTLIKAIDLKDIFPKKHPADISHILRKLREKKLLCPVDNFARRYHLCMENEELIAGITKAVTGSP